MNIQCLVATHKKVALSLPNYCQLMQVNCENNERWNGYLHDNDGNDNISHKNKSYCELTVLYHLWKNSNADIKGLFHYRRLLSKRPVPHSNLLVLMKKANSIKDECITERQIEEYSSDHDLIVEVPFYPSKCTVRERLLMCCYPSDIDILREVISQYYPNYLASFDEIMDSNHASYCNIIIAKREIFDKYCEWLFSILSHCEDKCSIADYDSLHMRIFGFFAEILMNVYIKKQDLKCKHVLQLDVFDYFDYNPHIYAQNKFAYIIDRVGIKLPTLSTEFIRDYETMCTPPRINFQLSLHLLRCF